MTIPYLEYGEHRQPLKAGEPVSVGSGTACVLRLQGEGVDEEHAVFELEGDRVLVRSRVAGERDVRVNGVASHAAALQAGDAVRFGHVEATFEMDGEASRLRLDDGVRELVRGVNAVGRDPGSGVVLTDESVSRKHAVIFVLPSGQVVLRDLGSANGTFFKGRRLGEAELQPGDEIRVGDEVLHLRREEEEVAAPAPGTDAVGGGAAKTVVGARPDVTVVAPPATPAAPKLELEVRGERRSLRAGTLRIGRAPDCEVILDDDALVSRHHAEVSVSGSEAVLRDLGSSNGTRVNGEAIGGPRVLEDGDRIGIGGLELTFFADIPVTPFAQTVVARKPSGAAGGSAAAPQGSATGRPPASPASAGIVPTDRESALLALDLDAEAGDEKIRKRYQELYSEFQIRLTNAPTPELKTTYERRLNELRAAVEILSPQVAASIDLPALEPVEGGGAAASGGGEAEGGKAIETAGGGAPAAAAQGGPKKRDLARSTLIMAAVDLVLAGAVVFCLLGSLRAQATLQALQDERDGKQAELREVEAAIPRTIAKTAALLQSKGALLDNADLKICNHAASPLRWQWLNTAWFDAERGDYRTFDTARDTEWDFLFDDRIEPGATFSGEYVVGEQRIWPGQAIFFAALFVYGGEDVLVVGATPELDGGCYPLNLDR